MKVLFVQDEHPQFIRECGSRVLNIARVDFKSLRLSLTGQNLFLITDYSGYDPELSSRKGNQGIEDVAPGINIGAYPNPRVYSFGVKLGF